MFGVFYDLSSKSDLKNAIKSIPLLPKATSTTTTEDLISPSKVTEERPQSSHHILVTTVSGDALEEYEKMSDMEIVERCVEVLRLMFPKNHVPSPIGHVVSRWGADPFAQMSYSYAAVGSGGEDYDAMAEDIDGRIFFAGEVGVGVVCGGGCGLWK